MNRPHELPTGPDVVGLEPIVLPAELVEGVYDPGSPSFQIVAPRCRYGGAWYAPVFTFGSTELQVAGDIEDWVEGGDAIEMYVPSGHDPDRVELHLVDVTLAPGALRGLTPDELADALLHPLKHVRERAMLDAGASETG
jgi:hypothetical protein